MCVEKGGEGRGGRDMRRSRDARGPDGVPWDIKRASRRVKKVGRVGHESEMALTRARARGRGSRLVRGRLGMSMSVLAMRGSG
jgi:hypothetical protein